MDLEYRERILTLKKAVNKVQEMKSEVFNIKNQPESIWVDQGLLDAIEKTVLTWAEKYKIYLTTAHVLELANNLQATLTKKAA